MASNRFMAANTGVVLATAFVPYGNYITLRMPVYTLCTLPYIYSVYDRHSVWLIFLRSLSHIVDRGVERDEFGLKVKVPWRSDLLYREGMDNHKAPKIKAMVR